jgi:hypothetical protein
MLLPTRFDVKEGLYLETYYANEMLLCLDLYGAVVYMCSRRACACRIMCRFWKNVYVCTYTIFSKYLWPGPGLVQYEFILATNCKIPREESIYKYPLPRKSINRLLLQSQNGIVFLQLWMKKEIFRKSGKMQAMQGYSKTQSNLYRKNSKYLTSTRSQGCQIFLGTIYQNGENYTNLPLNYQNGHKIYQMAIIYSKRP